MKPKRIKNTPISTHAEFFATVDELARLETIKRQIAADRDQRLIEINTIFDAKLEPVVQEMKAKVALAEAYAEDNRPALLPKDAKSAKTTNAVFGWRTGNRSVKLLSKVTVENVLNALKARGLGAFIVTTQEIAKAAILSAAQDDKSVTRVVAENNAGQPVQTEIVPLSDVGLKIVQVETFYIEPKSEEAATIKVEAA